MIEQIGHVLFVMWSIGVVAAALVVAINYFTYEESDHEQ